MHETCEILLKYSVSRVIGTFYSPKSYTTPGFAVSPLIEGEIPDLTRCAASQ